MHSSGRHHLHVRKRIYKKLEPFPHPNWFKRSLDRVMVFVALIGPIATLPQIIQTFETRDVSGLSLITWSLWTLVSLVWLVYGITHKDIPIFVSQGLYTLLCASMVYAIVLY